MTNIGAAVSREISLNKTERRNKEREIGKIDNNER
jgi:hypothetical protein